MTKRQRFKSAIKRGTGEAHLLIKDNPHIDFSHEITKAALKNLSYDNQCESRSEYVFSLIELSGQKAKIRQTILHALATEEKDGWGLYQLFELAGLFARQGDEEARKAIYKRFGSNTIKQYEDAGEAVIVELDGMKGLKHVAEVHGKAIITNDICLDEGVCLLDTFFLRQAIQKNFYEELEEAAKGNQYIMAYFNAVIKYKEEDQKKPAKWKREKYSYETISKRIEQNQTARVAPKRKKELSQTDINKLADDLLRQTDRKKTAAYLSIFCTVKWPYDYQYLLKYARYESMQHKKWRSKNWDMLVERACDALKFFSGTDIRKLAMEKLNAVRFPCEYMSLLVKNYKKGDAKLLVDIVMRCKTDDEIHAVAGGVIEIYEANKTRECKEPLEAVYERTSCGSCRNKVVKILMNNRILSDKIIKEIQFDSEEGTRKFFMERCQL